MNGYEIKPGANLAGANLSGVFLFRTYLHGANLSEADQICYNVANLFMV